MNIPSPYDVAIVGASIAGCTAATLFARRGLKVALIERSADPTAYKILCTHFIQASATPTIERLGLAEKIEAAGGVRNGLRIHTPWGWINSRLTGKDGHPSYGYSIRREKLDPMLRDMAASTPGVDFMPGWVARGLVMDKGRVVGLEIDGRDKPKQTLFARLTIGADGRQSRIADLAGVRTRQSRHNRFGYGMYYRQLPLASGTEALFWYVGRDIAYVFPNDDGLTLLACFVHKNKLANFKKDMVNNFVHIFDNLPLRPDIEHAERISDPIGVLELPNINRETTRPGLALIGDAAQSNDPVWGTGCGFAFQSAEWLVENTAAALINGSELEPALKGYAHQHHAAFAGHQFLMSNYSTGRAFNPLERLILSAGTRDQKIAEHVGEMGARNITMSQFIAPKILLRALKVNLTAHRSHDNVLQPTVAPGNSAR